MRKNPPSPPLKIRKTGYRVESFYCVAIQQSLVPTFQRNVELKRRSLADVLPEASIRLDYLSANREDGHGSSATKGVVWRQLLSSGKFQCSYRWSGHNRVRHHRRWLLIPYLKGALLWRQVFSSENSYLLIFGRA